MTPEARGAPGRVFAALGALLLTGCFVADNYPGPEGPRYAADHSAAPPAPRPTLRVVTYNLELAEQVERAIEVLAQAPLAGADVVLMQEMDAEAVDRIARALGLRYVFYPASIQKDGDDFGNAVLTPWPILQDRKLVLPHRDPYSDSLRAAVLAQVDVAGARLSVASVHNATPTVGLGGRLDQAEAILDAMEGLEGPRLVGGDFNTGDPGSLSQTVGLFEARGYTWSSEGTGTTVEIILGDFVSDLVFTCGLRVGARGVYRGDAGSDHQPVWVEYAWPP